MALTHHSTFVTAVLYEWANIIILLTYNSFTYLLT